MKNILLFSLGLALLVDISCTKNSIVPPYTPPVTTNFTVTALNHTKDTVNVGDTIYLTVAGMMYDTLNVYAYFTIKSSASGSPVYSSGSSSSPVKLYRTLGSNNVTGMNPWMSTIRLTGITSIPNSTLTISGNFIYQLSLSSEGGGLASGIDQGVKNKTVYIQ
jgi:hypothetical protein